MLSRRSFLGNAAVSAAGLGSAAAWCGDVQAAPPRAPQSPSSPRIGGSQRRWRTAFGLNGFQSSEQVFGHAFPVWEVLEFAQREGFEGIELLPGWLKGVYPDASNDKRIASLRDLFARYNLKIFSIQTFGEEAFQADRGKREAWVKQFADWAKFARKVGCECVGYWPGGALNGQTVDQGIESLAWSLREAGKIVADEALLLSVEIEPPFAFNKIEHLQKLLDAVAHPSVKGMCDVSHFDLMNGSRGKPHELLEKLGVDRIGYIHFTDTDGTLFHGTSRHLPCGDGHVDIPKLLETLWNGGYQGWINIDPWMTRDPYEACRKGKRAIETAYRRLSAPGR
jgi:sugar phosphate isomerase/epimerase